jgi:hypothetical protein
MNRYTLEARARDKYRNSVSDTSSRSYSALTRPLLTGLLSRRVTRSNEYHSALGGADAMAFIYELRSDLVDIDLDEVLPMFK